MFAAQLAAMQAQLHALQAKISSLQPASAKQLADDHAGQQPLIVPEPPATAPAAAAEKFIDIVFGFGSIIEDSSRSRSKDHETGRLAPGLSADVLVTDGNPVTDLSAITRPVMVYCRGNQASA